MLSSMRRLFQFIYGCRSPTSELIDFSESVQNKFATNKIEFVVFFRVKYYKPQPLFLTWTVIS